MLRLGRRTFDDDALLIMAIVNRTPDSFYDKGATFAFDLALDRVRSVIADGAEIDEGAERNLHGVGGAGGHGLQGDLGGAVQSRHIGHGGSDLADRRLGGEHVRIAHTGQMQLRCQRIGERKNVDIGRHQ